MAKRGGRSLYEFIDTLEACVEASRRSAKVHMEFELVLDIVHYCELCHGEERTELTRTPHPFIVGVVVLGGKPTNRYEVSIRERGQEADDDARA